MPTVTIRMEYYHDVDPANPTAYERFLYRMAMFDKEAHQWPVVVVESGTFMELAARKREEKVINPMEKFGKGTDTRQWFSGSTDALEEMLIMRLGSLPMNVIVVTHIDERRNEISGEILRGPFAPGRLSKRGLLCAAYQEQYHTFAGRGEDGKRFYALQTVNDGMWAATTQIEAPDPCFPTYDAIFQNRPDMKGKPIHVLVYGDTGTGKSTFASTFRACGNMLVWCFDPYGKDLPYHKGGEVGELQSYEIAGYQGSVVIPYRDVTFQQEEA